MKADKQPGARPPARRKFDLHISVAEETHSFLTKTAEHYARPQNRHVVLIIEAMVVTQKGLDPNRRDDLDHLLRHPDELAKVVRAVLGLLHLQRGLAEPQRDLLERLLRQPEELAARVGVLLHKAA